MTRDHDWSAYLTGAWQLRRTITDHRQQRTGRLTGTARFVGSGGEIMWAESGRLVMGAHDGEAWQHYTLRRKADGGAAILFPDGRAFFDLPSAQTRVSVAHECPPDRYDGTLSVQDSDHWQLQWRVRGPRKDYAMVSDYYRQPGAPGLTGD